MKRGQSACLMQTLHYISDENLPKEEAIEKVKNEVTKYKNTSSNKVKVLSEETLGDGTILISVKKKVSGYDIGNYFNN